MAAGNSRRLSAWDVTWLKSPVRAKFYYLYMMLDVFSRKITAWEVYEVECGNYAARLLQRGVLAEGCASTLQCLHEDNACHTEVIHPQGKDGVARYRAVV